MIRFGEVKVLAAVLVVALVATPVRASQHPAGLAPGQGLEISPPVLELSADPGQTQTVPIKIRNITSEFLVITAGVNDFVAKGEEGQPQIILDEAAEPGPYSLKKFVELPSSFQLGKDEIETVNVRITVPRNASPGGHYGVVRFTGQPPGAQEGVALSASVGTLVLLNVSGAVKEKAEFSTFFVSQSRKGQKPGESVCGSGGRSWYEAGPLCFTERFTNQGNVHIKPTGKVEVTNIFQRKVASLDLNANPARNVLPNSIRKFEQPWNKKFLFGRYRATANVVYGNNHTLTKSLVFWVIPWKLLALLLMLLLTAVWLVRRSLRRYNQRVIDRARKRG